MEVITITITEVVEALPPNQKVVEVTIITKVAIAKIIAMGTKEVTQTKDSIVDLLMEAAPTTSTNVSFLSYCLVLAMIFRKLDTVTTLGIRTHSSNFRMESTIISDTFAS